MCAGSIPLRDPREHCRCLARQSESDDTRTQQGSALKEASPSFVLTFAPAEELAPTMSQDVPAASGGAPARSLVGALVHALLSNDSRGYWRCRVCGFPWESGALAGDVQRQVCGSTVDREWVVGVPEFAGHGRP